MTPKEALAHPWLAEIDKIGKEFEEKDKELAEMRRKSMLEDIGDLLLPAPPKSRTSVKKNKTNTTTQILA